MKAQLRLPIAVVLVLAASVPGLVLAQGSASDQPAAPSADDALWQRATVVFDPLPEAAPNPDNPATLAKVELGKRLYFDSRLSKEGHVSCNSCHSLATFGVDNQSFSPGDAGELGGRNSPSVFNAALHAAQFWDGRAKDVEEQAGMPVLNPVEMAIPSREFLVERLARVEGYPEAFARAFPDSAEPLTYENIQKALGAFERTLLTPSRFDHYLRGDRQALTAVEKAGLQTFMDSGCASCHNGVNVGAQGFRKFGLTDSYWHQTKSKKVDEGRYLATGDPEDKYVFKIASLRNVEKTYPYFHDGSVATLEEALRVMGKVQVGLDFDDAQVAQVAAFLRSLTGEVPAEALTPPAPVGGGR